MDRSEDTSAGRALAATIEALVGAADDRDAARQLVQGCIAAGAAGAELWRRETGGWRRLAASGEAVGDGRGLLSGGTHYPARASVLQADDLALLTLSDHPGTDLREGVEDCAEALLVAATVLGVLDPPAGTGPAAVLPAA